MGAPVSDEVLTGLRNDACSAWHHAIVLTQPPYIGALTASSPPPTHDQIQMALKFAVTAQAAYTLACWRRIVQAEQEHVRQDARDVAIEHDNEEAAAGD